MAGKPGMHTKHHLGEQAQDKLRTKIKAGVILDRLVKHATGEIEMSPSQVQTGLGLMRKVLPDLASVDMTAETRVSYVDTLRSIAEQAGWATAAVQVAMESHESERNAAAHTSDNGSDATSDAAQATD